MKLYDDIRKNNVRQSNIFKDKKYDKYGYLICGIVCIVFGVLGRLGVILNNKRPVIFYIIIVFGIFGIVGFIYDFIKNKKKIDNFSISLLHDIKDNNILSDLMNNGIDSSKCDYAFLFNDLKNCLYIGYSFNDYVYLELEIGEDSYIISIKIASNAINLFNEHDLDDDVLSLFKEFDIKTDTSYPEILNNFRLEIEENADKVLNICDNLK